MKEPVDHILRPRLPWRSDDAEQVTECGYDASKVKTISREELAQRRKDLGHQRTAMLTCMTCSNTAGRWNAWEDDPRGALGREIEWERGNGYWPDRSIRGTRLLDELTAIEQLIAAHADEFSASVAEIAQRRDWNERKAARAARPVTPQRKL